MGQRVFGSIDETSRLNESMEYNSKKSCKIQDK